MIRLQSNLETIICKVQEKKYMHVIKKHIYMLFIQIYKYCKKVELKSYTYNYI